MSQACAVLCERPSSLPLSPFLCFISPWNRRTVQKSHHLEANYKVSDILNLKLQSLSKHPDAESRWLCVPPTSAPARNQRSLSQRLAGAARREVLHTLQHVNLFQQFNSSLPFCLQSAPQLTSSPIRTPNELLLQILWAGTLQKLFSFKWCVSQIRASCVRLRRKLWEECLRGGKCGNITSCVCLHARLLLTLL